MQRRSLLAALAVGVPAAAAGCVGTTPTETRTDGDPGTGPADTPTDTPTPDDDPWSTTEATSIVDLATVPRTYALGPTDYRDDGATVAIRFVRTATAGNPATVRATLTNEAEVAETVHLDRLPPFGRSTSTIPRQPGTDQRHGDAHTYRASLVFAPAADNPLVDDPPAVERDADGLWRASEVDDWTPDPLRLAPGESVTAAYHLVGHPDGAGRGRPTGVYAFPRADAADLRVSVWHTGRPGPDGDSRFAGTDLPPLPGEATTGWYHEAGPATRTYVRPGTERTDLPAAVPFTFINHAREATGCGHWQLYKLVDGAWFRLGPFVHTGECRLVRPGGSERTVLRAAGGEALPCDDGMTFGYLGGGRYAFVAGYGAGVDRSGALIAVDAPDVAVASTDDVSTSRDGTTVTVTSSRFGDGKGPDDARLVVERVEAAGRRLIAEQVMQRRGLRNTLPFFQAGIDTVALRTDRSVATRATRFGEEPFRFIFDGQAYAATRADD